MGHNGSASASGSNSSSQGGTTSLERHGSIVGYGDSSQRLLQNNSSDYGIRKSNVYGTELKNSSSKSSRLYSEASSSDYHGNYKSNKIRSVLGLGLVGTYTFSSLGWGHSKPKAHRPDPVLKQKYFQSSKKHFENNLVQCIQTYNMYTQA